MAYPPHQFKGIVALQVLNHPEVTPRLVDRLLRYFSLHPGMEDYCGKLIIVDPSRVRVRE